MSSKKKKIVVIGHHDDPTWASIEQLKEGFKHYWFRYQKEYFVYYYEQLEEPFSKELIEHALSAKVLVFLRGTRLSAKLLRVVSQFPQYRDMKVVFYTEEAPSIAFSNYKVFGIDQLLRSDDLLIAQNRRDIQLINECCNISTAYVPASYPGLFETEEITFSPPYKNLCYVGRISSQKNLHTLFLALYTKREFLRKQKVQLFVYGREDFYGSPNMGFRDKGYLNYLKYLIKELDISDLVVFKGFYQDRNKMLEEIKENRCLNITLSLHSDEDFGFSLAEMLSQGIYSIATDWGGFSEFLQDFPKGTTAINVYDTEWGPTTNPFEVGEAIHSAFRLKKPFKCSVPQKYFASPLVELKKEKKPYPKGLQFFEFAKKVHSQIHSKELEEGHPFLQVFKDYSDPLANKIFHLYGAKNIIPFPEEGQDIYMPPWVYYDYSSDNLSIEDPHRGTLNFHILKGDFNSKIMAKEIKIGLSKKSIQKLIAYGVLYL